MDIRITQKDLALTAADNTYINNRLYFGLAANNQVVDGAQISLCAIPGSESESIHHCRVEVVLANGRSVIGDSTESDIYVAIDRAVERSCSRVNSSGELYGRAFAQTASAAFRENHLSSAV